MISKTLHSRLNKFLIFALLCFSGMMQSLYSGSSYISAKKEKGYFTLVAGGHAAQIVVSAKDYPGVQRVTEYFQSDIEKITNVRPEIFTDTIPHSKEIILIGTLGKNPMIDQMVKDGRLQVMDIQGKWECSLIQVIEKPMKGVKRALVIVGSDKRGTIYGTFDLSSKIGVSPWYWWADVPIKHQSELYIIPGRYTQGEPAVKYRGIFLNDEEPALGRWTVENYGGFNAGFYEKVFELILRLKGNFLWPAMWWASFASDDPLNPKLADELGIVMSTSHHEPMMRAHAEWRPFGGGAWNYETNAEQLRQFWTEGIERMGSCESVVTLAMRGDGDLAMSESTNVALLERIVADQRKILSQVTGKDVTTIPQVWALYKEVQDYYDRGMCVPDDVTLLLCDDNWGNVRRLPKPDDPPRTGGYGMYYHFDFVGGPRSYKWLNTCPIARIWEQMHLCYRYGVNRIWLVNVGDLKPMEFPISFFLDYAWAPDTWHADRLPEYTRLWVEQQFGPKYAKDITDMLTQYTRYNGRRKPEMLSPDTYSLFNYQEAEMIVSDYKRLADQADRLYHIMPEAYKDAFYQLILHPVMACANLNDLNVTVAKNHLYAKQGRSATNDMAAKAKTLFEKDAEITNYYNKIMADGKWNHMMDQTHIGYSSWQQPEKNIMPEVFEIKPLTVPDMGVAIEGSEDWWPMEESDAVLPEFNPYQQPIRYFDVFNRGSVPFKVSIFSKVPWISIDPSQILIEKEQRIWVCIDWKQVPVGQHRIPIIITGPNENQIIVYAIINHPLSPKRNEVVGFVESNGYVSMEAEHFTRAVESDSIKWLCIPDFGRTLSGMTPMPVTASIQIPQDESPRLEYQMHLFTKGETKVITCFSPTQNFNHTQGLRYGISFDNQTPQIISIHENDTIPDWKYPPTWNEAVSNNIKVTVSKHIIQTPGEHVLKFWMVDPGIVLQKLIVDTGDLQSSYLGPPESYYQAVKMNKKRK